MAEFERELIRERVKAGLAHARSKGRIGGRPKVKRERDKDAKLIRGMRAGGDSYSEIAEELGRSRVQPRRAIFQIEPLPTRPVIHCTPVEAEPF
jgi:DNA invertase Pin-like site-specific DNA recombinase